MRTGSFCLGYVVGALTIILLGVGGAGFAAALKLDPVKVLGFTSQPSATPTPLFVGNRDVPQSTPVAPTATAVRTVAPAATPTRPAASPTTARPATTPVVTPGVALTTAQIVEQARSGVVRIQAGSSTGTGFVIDSVMNIVTNAHVVEGETSVTVRFVSGKTATGRVVATDLDRDLAIVRVTSDRVNPLKLGDSLALKSGEDVIAIGYPLGLVGEPSVSRGIVSGQRAVSARSDQTFIQTDAAVNPGNSGGPLLNIRGEVVGIVTARIASTGAGQTPVSGINLAIAITPAKPILDRLIAAR